MSAAAKKKGLLCCAFSDSLFSVTTATSCSRRRHCRPPKCLPSRYLGLLRRKATRDARHSLSPAIDQELVPFTLSSSHRPQVATKSGMARLRQAFGATGVRVTCGADPLLALRSRRSFKEISVSLPQQEIRPLAPSFSFRCDSCLEHRGRVSFGSKNAKCNIVPSLTALALYGVFQRLRHAIGFRVTSQNASFFRGEQSAEV